MLLKLVRISSQSIVPALYRRHSTYFYTPPTSKLIHAPPRISSTPTPTHPYAHTRHSAFCTNPFSTSNSFPVPLWLPAPTRCACHSSGKAIARNFMMLDRQALAQSTRSVDGTVGKCTGPGLAGRRYARGRRASVLPAMRVPGHSATSASHSCAAASPRRCTVASDAPSRSTDRVAVSAYQMTVLKPSLRGANAGRGGGGGPGRCLHKPGCSCPWPAGWAGKPGA